uniref:(northern house mosquito) hypothetical protein n=1 Tax=Culex pipiens TaxID=7175 RepID=A0A8D8BSC5_CULPI
MEGARLGLDLHLKRRTAAVAGSGPFLRWFSSRNRAPSPARPGPHRRVVAGGTCPAPCGHWSDSRSTSCVCCPKRHRRNLRRNCPGSLPRTRADRCPRTTDCLDFPAGRGGTFASTRAALWCCVVGPTAALNCASVGS